MTFYVTCRMCRIFKMLQLSFICLCVLTTGASANRLDRNLKGSVSLPVNSTTSLRNKTAASNTSLTNANTLNPKNAGDTTSLPVNTTNASKPTQIQAEEMPKLDPKDQQPPPNGLFSRTPTGAALRGLYVLVGLTAVVMLYIAIKLIRLRRKKMRIRKYGLIANVDDVEMTPLGADDDEEDTTLFDAHNHIGR